MESPADETPSQKQARLRRERRQAKIASGGTDRLAAITGVQGRKAPEPAPVSKPASTASSTPQTPNASIAGAPKQASVEDGDHPDPDHMDLTEFFPRQAPAGGLGQMPPPPGMEDDPMFKMLQQLMGSAQGQPGGGGAPGGPDGLPDLASLLGGGASLFGGAPAEEEAKPTVSAATWRIVHTLASILLAVYVVFSSPVRFNGTKAGRELADLGGVGDSFGARLFFWFATVEVVLQSSRFAMERGQVASTGMIGTIVNLLPEPWAGYIRIAWRYSVILRTVASDALVLVFVLGVLAWWNNK